MAVTGRKVSAVLCEPCVNDGYDIVADGYCKECEENMCSKCFQHHRKGKVCRNHVFLDGEYKYNSSSTGGTDGMLDKCPKHLQEIIKFYCPTHEVIGCGDCIICEHKSCEVSYISDVTMGLDGRECTDNVVKEIENCCNDIKEYESKIQKTIANTHTTHKKFIYDAQCFKEETMKNINKLTVDACEQASGIKTESLSTLEKLEVEVSDITDDLSAMKGTAESHEDKPKNNFVSAIRLRKRLKEIEDRFTEIDKLNKAEVYTFLKCYSIECAIKHCEGLDLIECEQGAEKNQDNVDKDYRTVTLKKKLGAIGLLIVGGYDGLPLAVGEIGKDTPAQKSGEIIVSDQIISINSVEVTDKSRAEAIQLIKKNDDVTFVVCRQSPQDYKTMMQGRIQRKH